MEQLMKKLDEQNITVADYATIIKIIQASLQRGAIRAEECTTVGKIYEKLNYMIQKHFDILGQKIFCQNPITIHIHLHSGGGGGVGGGEDLHEDPERRRRGGQSQAPRRRRERDHSC